MIGYVCYHTQTKFEVMFLHLSVILFMVGGGWLPSVHHR